MNCLFPVAGYGTRFLPVTKSIPKEMLTIVDKPLIQYAVEDARSAGIRNMVFVTGRGKRAVEDYFDCNYELESVIKGSPKEEALSSIRKLTDECTFTYTRQRDMKGLGHAVLTARDLIGSCDYFALALADELCLPVIEGESALSQLLHVNQSHNCSVIAVSRIPDADVSKYGIVETLASGSGINRITSIKEKPEPHETDSRFAAIGRYILHKDIFEFLANQEPGVGNEIQLTDAIQAMLDAGHTFLAVEVDCDRYDCGSPAGFVAAVNAVFNRSRS